MEELALQQPELIGREEELNKLKQSLDNAIACNGSTIFVSGEAGIGKTRLVSELIKEAEAKNAQAIQGWCLAESLEPLMPIKTALREAGLYHLISGDPPPLVVSAYLMNNAGMLIAKAEREESDLDSEIFTSMLKVVGDFVQDSLSLMGKKGGTGLNSLGYEKYKIFIQTLGKLSLAIVIEGSESEFLINDMKRTLAEIGNKLDDWSGDTDAVAGFVPKVSWFIDSGKYDGKFLVDDSKILQENLFDNVLLGVQRLSSEGAFILFLDDLQWADSSTLTLLHYLARNTKEYKVLILGTYRPEEIVQFHDEKRHQLETVMQNMNRENLLERIELKRLEPVYTEKIIESVLGKIAFEKSFFEKVYKETEGTPLFVLEVVKLLVENGAISQDEEGVWKRVTDIEMLDIPSKVYDVIKRRLGRLIKDQREILECAAVIGNEFSPEILENIIEIQRLKLLKNLSEIEKTHRLIHYLKEKYRFDHSKIREVLYNDISEILRKEYHKIIADTITEVHKDNLDEVVSELAYHYYKAGDKRAGEYLVEAGNQAKDKYANEEAVRQYTNALHITTIAAEKASLLERLGDTHTHLGDYDKALENFEEARKVTRDDKTIGRMLRKSAEVYDKKGNFDKSLKMLDEAMDIIGEMKGSEQGRINLDRGVTHWRRGDYDRAVSFTHEAIKMFEESKDEEKDKGNALRTLGNIHLGKGDYDSALEQYGDSLRVMEKLRDLWGIAAALNNIGNVYETKGSLDKALYCYERSLEIILQVGNQRGIALSLNNVGNVYFVKGDLNKALDYYERSLEKIQKIGDQWITAAALNNIGNVFEAKGDLDKTLDYYERSFKIRQNIGDQSGIALSLNNIGNVYETRGDLNKALDYYERSLEIRQKIKDKLGSIYSYYGLAKVNLELGNIERAFEHAQKAIDISVGIYAKSEEGKSRRVLGRIYWEKEEWDRGVTELEKAKVLLEEGDNKKEIAIMLYEYALLFKAKGEPDKAREHLEKALSMFEKMGMKLWGEKCRKALEEL